MLYPLQVEDTEKYMKFQLSAQAIDPPKRKRAGVGVSKLLYSPSIHSSRPRTREALRSGFAEAPTRTPVMPSLQAIDCAGAFVDTCSSVPEFVRLV